MTTPCRTYVATEASLTWPELLAARAIQQELGAGKRCAGCGRWLPVGAFPGYGAATCSECQGLQAWAA